ncbi:radical SAM protein [Candidatus Venteria ishoeyi]|uniref:radical SAM/SPASM domain-containing protein n=1 Tax=Candidatus Venteria ishoeyi TaxID=1899563 RepID=UPI0025A5BE2C|nr:radical SAM protein [Candidatus Venteria ishoeyi]MDM8546188.1 radical SAM protein [Candidatus Venteria ishoeyi]
MINQASSPWRITFDTNPDDCNFRCVMCEEHSEHNPNRRTTQSQKRRMPIALIEKIIAEAAPLGLREVIPSTMGEPLLYDDFERILELCQQYQVKLNLTTNGSFPKHNGKGGVDYWAQRIVPVTSDVKFSWNGATAKTHEKIMLGARWDKALNNLKHFIQVRNEQAAQGGDYCRITFQLTFLESNLAELPDIIKLAAQLGVDRVKGHHLWAHFSAIEPLSLRRNAEAIERWNQVVEQAQTIAETDRLPNGKKVLLENIYPLEVKATQNLMLDGECPFLGQEAWINTQGRFDPCCAPDIQRRSLGNFGNLHEQSLAAIWYSEAYQVLQQNYQQQPLCIACNMRKPKESQ